MEDDYVISKKDFKEYFNGKNIIDKEDYLLYKKLKNARKYYDENIIDFNKNLETKIITLLSL